MISRNYDPEADALYVKLSDSRVARTLGVDSGTLVDLDDTDALVGIEVIRPERPWPLEEILTRFTVSGKQASDLRQHFPQLAHT